MVWNRTKKIMRHAAKASAPAPATVLAALVAVAGASSHSAFANPADLFGVGAREIGMGNAFTAVADSPMAAYYNLGGAVQMKRTTVSLGIQLGKMSLGNQDNCVGDATTGCSEEFFYRQTGVLTRQQKQYGYENPHGFVGAFVLPIAPKLNFALATYLPVDIKYEDGSFSGIGMRLVRFATIDPNVPDYVMYQNRPQRFAMYSGISYEIVPGLGVGLGVSMLAGGAVSLAVNGSVTVESTGTDAEGNTSTEIRTELNPIAVMDLGPITSPLVGVLWNLGTLNPSLQGWQIGLTYRGKSELLAETMISTDIAMQVDLGDEEPYSYGVALEDLPMTIVDHSTPQQAAVGVSGLFADRVRLSADVTWTNWRQFKPPVASFPDDADVGLGLTIDLGTGREVDTDTFQDVIAPRIGLESRLGPYETDSRLRGIDLYLRGGAGYEPNPFGLQTRFTNLLNSDRVLLNLGTGITTHNPLFRDRDLPVSLDVAFQYHYLIPTHHVKDFEANADSNPPDGYPIGGEYVSQGSVLQMATSLQFGF